MPIIRVDIWPGRPQETKIKIAKEITDTMVKNIGCPTQAVTVIFEEIPQENWVIGGEPASNLFKNKK